MNSFHFREGMKVLYFLPSTHVIFYDFDLCASHARTFLPAALASVPLGFVIVRVRVRVGCANRNGHRPTNTRSSYSTPGAVLKEVEHRFDVFTVYFLKMGECREVLGGGPAPPSKL